MEVGSSTMDERNGFALSDLIGTTKDERIDKWWEVVKHTHDGRPIRRGATLLVERVIRVYEFDREFTYRVLEGYRQFMELKAIMNDSRGMKLEPPIPIMQMWEQHLLDTLRYTDDCFFLFGKVIHHDPDACTDTKATLNRMRTTRIAAQARYGSDLDKEIWGYYDVKEGMDEDEIFVMDDETVSQIESFHRIPRSGGSGGGGGGGRLPVAEITKNVSKEEIPSAVEQMFLHSRRSSDEEKQQQQPYLDSRNNSDVRRPEDDDKRNTGLDDQQFYRRETDPTNPRVVEGDTPRHFNGRREQHEMHYYRSPGGRAPPAREPVFNNYTYSHHHHQGRVRHHPTITSRKDRSASNNAAAAADTMPAAQKPISLFVRDRETGEETRFSLRHGMSSLGIVFSVVARRKGLKNRGSTIKFSYKGRKLSGYETPFSLGMQDQDRIDFSIKGERKN